MKYVYLLRHAKSSWDDMILSDHERPLNRRGVKASAIMGKRLAKVSPAPDLILVFAGCTHPSDAGTDPR